MTDGSATEQVRLAELLAVLALGADLGMGQPMEHAIGQCVLALRIGDRLGLADRDRSALYYVSLIAWVGCHIDAYEQAKWFGDDFAPKANFRLADPVGVRALGQMMRQIGAGHHGADRAKIALKFFARGMGDANAMLANHSYAADQLGAELGLPEDVRAAVLHTFERWDGKGAPTGTKGEEIRIEARIVNLADVLEVFHRAGGVDAAVEVAKQRRGTQFDPTLVDLIAAEPDALFADFDQAATWDAIIDAEPSLTIVNTSRLGFIVPGLIAAMVAQLFMGGPPPLRTRSPRDAGRLERRFARPLTAALRADVATMPPDTTLAEFFSQHLLGNGRRQSRWLTPAVCGRHAYRGAPSRPARAVSASSPPLRSSNSTRSWARRAGSREHMTHGLWVVLLSRRRGLGSPDDRLIAVVTPGVTGLWGEVRTATRVRCRASGSSRSARCAGDGSMWPAPPTASRGRRGRSPARLVHIACLC